MGLSPSAARLTRKTVQVRQQSGRGPGRLGDIVGRKRGPSHWFGADKSVMAPSRLGPFPASAGQTITTLLYGNASAAHQIGTEKHNSNAVFLQALSVMPPVRVCRIQNSGIELASKRHGHEFTI